MRRLVDVLGDPQRAYPVIHLTGTNGKGSTARMITALLAESGLTVGTYTSPHLQAVNERLTRNLEAIADDDLAEVLSDIAALEDLAGVTPSYFEILTAAAFRWFADIAVDVAVVEVGLLGRFDATNVADAAVAVVTNVGSDHTDYRGDWRHAIAQEKAGIVKPGSVLVLGETDPDLIPVFLDERPMAVLLREEDFAVDRNDVAVGGRVLDVRTPAGVFEQLYVPLHGRHQGDNASLALTAAEAFFGRALTGEVAADALASVTVPGRFEIVSRNPLLVLDGAHNADGAAAAAMTLAEDFEVDGSTILVLGALSPRRPGDLLEALDASSAGLVIATDAPSPRAVPADEIAAAAEALGAPAVIAVPSVEAAVDLALAEAGPGDAVLVTGSLYVVGAARAHLHL
ncbi:MAG: bifunctional folylpolyglutamate synthase/dihydrofolate synthase [Chloroflexi bacterium]|nr:bifunctional folylpolyglutamate synthase/dihydrofolate synthase [Chloroflexota bacterium]